MLLMQSKILHYMRQMAVITPYAQFLFRFVSEASEYVICSYFFSLHLSLYCCGSVNYTTELRLFPKDNLIKLLMSILSFSRIYLYFFCSKNVTVQFARRTDIMPPVPTETKYHPSAVDLLLIKRLIGETSKQNLLQFLQHEFVNIGKPHAERLIGKCHILEVSRF